ncbi:MAG: SDR family NAD(P)-dependent oxidoreductase, partial [Deltaproteobacteria bacterium]|nr:SDR family NAD(P)-dependent oxidoreductase [Deltaproteobacteria bacterium]
LKVPSEDIESDQPIADYGIDSILVVTFINELKKAFDVDLNTTVIFDYSTIDKLSDYMLKTHGEKIESHILKNDTVQNKKYTPLDGQDEDTKTSVLSINKNRFSKIIKPSVNKDITITTSIAVTGISGQFPGAEDIDEFWHNLINSVDGVQELPPEYLDQKKYSSKKQSGKTYCKWGGILKEKDCFDPLFFNISPREAESMNPHQRLILQESWRALEDAGYNPGSLAGSKTGVFIGAEPTGYMHETFTGSSEAIVASRLSYFLDLSGPALVVNTGCSSSGVAIHLACESLRNNETSLALAGGVFAALDQTALITLSETEMLSYSGRCRTFDESGDGTVFSEGVGIVVLKRLNEAISDGDHIYGIIEASGTNQDGASNGITAPNGVAQERLITDVYKQYSINPEEITYAEVHGTGTKLGDPVEANSLVRAFKQFTDKNNFCAVGSSKSNIGHTAAAAAVAGLIKILLSIRHHKIPGLIHFNKLNPLIELENSAFYMNTKLSEWRSENNKPLKAALNSFGNSGTNVHLVVKEYIPHNVNLSNSKILNEDYIVVISAKNEERLKAYALKFNSFLKQFPETDMKELAFTLQTGREIMTHRLAVVATSIVTLSEKLTGYCKGESDIENLYIGNVKTDRRKNDILVSGSTGKQFINAVVEERDFNKIAQLWVSGIKIDWNLFYLSEKPNRISLPTYPFTKERYWKSTTELENQMLNVHAFASKLHPLLHQNTSNFEEQRYSSTFTGKEFFLSDHVVKGQRILPGVAYLEMAQTAATHTTGSLREGKNSILLKNVVWIRPIAVGDENVQVHIGLFPEDNGEIAYKIYCDSEEGDTKVYSQGNALLCKTPESTTLDIKTIQEECNKTILSSSQCYDVFKSIELEYGPAYQGIEKVYVGENQALSKLALPSIVSDTKNHYILHPCMLDSAFQSLIGFMQGSADTENRGKPALPFALQELQILSNCTANMWAWLRYSSGSKSDDKIQKLDIDMCDENGNVCVRMKGFSLRVLEGDIGTDSLQTTIIETSPQPFVELATLTPVWDFVFVEKGEQFPSQIDKVLVIGGVRENENAVQQIYPKAQAIEIGVSDSIDNITEKVNNCGVVDHIVWIAPYNSLESLADESLIEEQDCGVNLFFRTIKALLNLGYGTKDLGWSVITIEAQSVHKDNPVSPVHSSIHGLVGSMAKEFQNWKIRLVDLEKDSEWPLNEIFKIVADPLGNAIAYRGHEWYKQQLIPFNSSITNNVLSYKKDGVYVVIGGAGGIGEVWSEYMIHTYNAQIIWIGRRKKDADIQAKLDKLAASGSIPLYISADATDLKSLQGAYKKIKQDYSKINGIIHTAIVLSDKSLANMEETQFKLSLSAKVDVSVRIAQVFEKERLDFVMFFSSMQSFSKSPGQSNYAAGCTFKDSFAKQLSKEWTCSVKIINWGYWGSVGIVASKEYQDRMTKIGLGSIEPFEAMEALEKLLSDQMDQVIFLKTTKPKVLEEIASDDLITIYSENEPINFQSIYSNIPKHDLQHKRIEDSDMSQIKHMNLLLCRLLWAQLQSIGLFDKNSMSITDLKTAINLPDLYDRWLEESIKVLIKENYLSCSEDLYSVVNKTVDVNAIWKEWDKKKEIWLKNKDMHAMAVLVDTTIRALPEILTGKVPATDIMFPDSSMKLVEGIYKQNRIADYFNEVLADTVVTYIQERIKLDESAKVRILEVGAGTGGTSAVIFPRIKPYSNHIVEYCYTDISKAFLMHADKEYGHDNPYLTGKIFNVEKPLEGQGIDVGNYDIVIATNVLHATKNIRQTLRNSKAALKNNGMILLNEISNNNLSSHLTFGLLEGWWLYEDPALRIKGSPGLLPETWKNVLEMEGFGAIFFPEQESHDFGQQIVVAKSDGVVRQKRQIQPESQRVISNANRSYDNNNILQISTTQTKPHISKIKPIQDSKVTDQMASDHIREVILEKVSEALKVDIDILEIDESFADYGVDSIIGVNLVQVINQHLRIELETTSLFDHSTVNQLTAHIFSQYKDNIIPFLTGNTEPIQGSNVTDQMIENHIREVILEKVSEALKVDIDILEFDESFADYGVDSIIGVNLVQVINQHLRIELETTSLFDHSTVNQLTTYIFSKYKENFILSLTDNEKQIVMHHDLPSNIVKQSVNANPKRFTGRILHKSGTKTKEIDADESIAIIGMSGRFAKSNTISELWEHLKNGTDLVEEVKRWKLSEYYQELSEDPNYCNHGGFLENIDEFDPMFFNISGLEATYMDPQQRIFLEESWKALEDSGYAGIGAQGIKCGIYVGCGGGDYKKLIKENPPPQSFWGNASSITPARIAYYLDLQGPAIAVDTACSSSLVAIHLACQSLRTEETELAIAGGVFVQSTPEFYLVANRGQMLSPTGRCHTFDERADGFVPGEGAGVVVLKRLKEAISDNDHIYGIIRGSGINQDGKTNGITAPSAKSQERLERQVYDTFNINPKNIQMVEAHGTGTILGDPIEMEALTKAFKKDTDKKQYCAIGSIKTNIGHTATASGVAGVIKILLSLQHKKIPPSLHYQSCNPNIRFDESPFYVNTNLKDWNVEAGSPRCAAISSFGFSGTNAHVVIEETLNTERQHSEKPGYLIVLSARNSKQLQWKVKQLVEYCEQDSGLDCGNISYTLLMGRKHFNCRFACVVRNQQELVKLFKKWLEKGKVTQIYTSEFDEKDHREEVSLKRFGNRCIEDCQNTENANYLEHLSTIANLYIQGYTLEYEQLFSKNEYSRISLPTYPFEKEKYWISDSGLKERNRIPDLELEDIGDYIIKLHPLLHQNTSDFSEQRFCSTFNGQEFFLADHVFNDQRILPGVAYLEMAYAAINHATGSLREGATGIQFKNVVWGRPIAVGDEKVQVHIGLFPEDNGEITYEIYCDSGEDGYTVHSQGNAVICRSSESTRLDIKAKQKECSLKVLSSAQCYEAFKSMGLEYGPGHRGIEKVYVGENQVLSKLALPPTVSHTKDQFVLHPSMLDSALQSSVGFMLGSVDTKNIAQNRPPLPFAVEDLEILSNCTANMWAWIRYSTGSKPEDKIQKLDIDMCDGDGTVCVRLKGFSSRVMEDEVELSESSSIETLMIEPKWKEQEIIMDIEVVEYTEHLIILLDPENIALKSIKKDIKDVQLLVMRSKEKGIANKFQEYSLQIFEEIQRIIKEKPSGKKLIQVVISNRNDEKLFFGLSGLLKTAELENPKITGQIINLDNSEEIVKILQKNIQTPYDMQIKYENGKRYAASFEEVKSSEEVIIPWKDKGIYLITGGAGGLGQIFTKEILTKVKNTTLLLTGRSELDGDKQALLKELETLGAKVDYRQVDITNKQSVISLMQSIQEEYKKLNGIIHSAGIIRDNLILKKTREEFEEVLSPKVTGLVNLDEASRNIPLDFFIFFSSTTGGMGNIGQSDYACANAFMDVYAEYRNTLVSSNDRHGKTLSINWPLWKYGGMSVDKETEKMMMKSMGMIPMHTAKGINALYQSFSSGRDQVAILEGNVALMRNSIGLDLLEHDKFDYKFYRKLSEEVLKGELSEEQVETIIMA